MATSDELDRLRAAVKAADVEVDKAKAVWEEKLTARNRCAEAFRKALDPDIRASEVLRISASETVGPESECG